MTAPQSAPMNAPALDCCPFCGATPHKGLGKKQRYQNGDEYQNYLIWCPKGHAKFECATEEAAVRAWNTRSSQRGVPSREEVAWNPIDEAPIDGTKILAFALRDGEPFFAITWWRKAEDKRGYIGWGEFNSRLWPATHWQPLPAPPPSLASYNEKGGAA